MTKTFQHNLEDGRVAEVSIMIECRDQDGCDATYEVEAVEVGNEFIELTALSPRDQTDIDRHAQDIADENGPEAWHDWMLARADAAYDRMRDGD